MTLHSPEEDNTLTGGPLADGPTINNGLGTFMHHAAGINAAFQASTLDIAHIVIQPIPFSIHVKGEVQAGTGPIAIVDWYVPMWPEPASLGLALTAGFALVTRRRDHCGRN